MPKQIWKIIRRSILTVLATLSIGESAFGADTALSLHQAKNPYAIGPHLHIFRDSSRGITFEEIAAGKHADRFLPNVLEVPNLGFTADAVWMKFSMRNDEDLPVKWLIQEAFPLVDRIELYHFQNGKWHSSIKGNEMPFYDRGIRHRTFLFPIGFKPHEEIQFLMRVVNDDSMQLPLYAWTLESFQTHDHEEQYALGIYYGIILVMAAYNLFLFFSLRDKGFIYYVIYMVTFGLFLMAQYGLAYEYLWPNFNWGARRMNPVLAGLLEFSTLLFAGHFLNLKQILPKFYAVRKGLMFLALAASISALFLPLNIAALEVVFLGLATATFALSAGTVALRHGYRPAKYFMVAFGLLIFGAVLYALKTFGALPATFVTNFGMQIGSALEVTLLSLGLADRMNVLEAEKQQAQESLLKEQQDSLQKQVRLTESYARLVPQTFLEFLGKGSILDVKPGDQVQREMTVLFSDIRSFTELSEKMSPKENFEFLNTYLQRMTPLIQAHRGHIDKYLGDGIMALFPENPDDAIQASIAMQQALASYNADRLASGLERLQIGVGLHTGSVTFGTLGNEERMEVTVISDTVNLTARIEQLCKEYGAQILISQTAFQKLQDPGRYLIRVVERTSVKGKREDVAIFEVLDGRLNEEKQLFQKTLRDFEKGVYAFAAGEFTASSAHFKTVLNANPGDRAALRYLEKIPS